MAFASKRFYTFLCIWPFIALANDVLAPQKCDISFKNVVQTEDFIKNKIVFLVDRDISLYVWTWPESASGGLIISRCCLRLSEALTEPVTPDTAWCHHCHTVSRTDRVCYGFCIFFFPPSETRWGLENQQDTGGQFSSSGHKLLDIWLKKKEVFLMQRLWKHTFFIFQPCFQSAYSWFCCIFHIFLQETRLKLLVQTC